MRYARLTFALIGILVSGPMLAQENDANELDGTELEYTYSDGGSVILTFYDGLLKFRWVAGPNEGATGEDFEYKARTIDDERYMVSWQMAQERNHVTMVIDLGRRTLYTSALMGYETDHEAFLFDKATIHRVER